MTTKILALTDALGNLVKFILMPGQRHDIKGVQELIADLHFDALVADKAFDANWLIEELSRRGAQVVICLDVDALDPAVMPAVIGRTAGGLGYWQVFELIAGVAAKARIAAFDMVEFMPERDIDGLGAMTAAQLLAGVIGIIARQA